MSTSQGADIHGRWREILGQSFRRSTREALSPRRRDCEDPIPEGLAKLYVDHINKNRPLNQSQYGQAIGLSISLPSSVAQIVDQKSWEWIEELYTDRRKADTSLIEDEIDDFMSRRLVELGWTLDVSFPKVTIELNFTETEHPQSNDCVDSKTFCRMSMKSDHHDCRTGHEECDIVSVCRCDTLREQLESGLMFVYAELVLQPKESMSGWRLDEAETNVAVGWAK